MKLPPLKPREVVKVLVELGFEKKRQTGSHLILRHPITKKIVVVPIHKGRELKSGVIKSIIKQTGLSRKEFLKRIKDKK